MIEVRISEQVAYQMLQFLQRYRVDVEQLLKQSPADGEWRGYLEAMRYGDVRDTERLEEALRKALKRRETLWSTKA